MSVIMEKFFKGVELKGGSLPTTGVVGLYFSAHWCPPCRGFTPKLAETYKLLKGSDKTFEVVFVSSDKDEEQFNSYYAEMPWLALPFENRDLKNTLSKKFKVSGIPTFVLLDAKTGDVITTEGRSAISKDPQGLKHPWIPPTALELLGDTFTSSSGSADTSIKGKFVGVYFSAHWCGPCRNFTPKLAETYKKVKESRSDFEVVFCSADRDETQFQEYFGTMPWLAIPFSDSERKDALNELFGVEGIPTLVILDPSGKVITKAGDDAVRADPAGADFPWQPKPVRDIEQAAGDLNQTPALIALCEASPAAAQAAVTAAMLAAAADWRAQHPDDDMVFCTATAASGVSGQVRKLCKLDGDGAAGAPPPALVLLDIPDDGGFYVSESPALDEAAVRAFLAAYASKSLSRQQLG